MSFVRKEIGSGVGDTGARVGIIGSSQIGAVMGIGGYGTYYKVYKAFNGIKEDLDRQTKDTFEYGHILEDAVAKMFTYKTGIKVMEVPYAYVCEDNPKLVCHVDREAVGLVDGKRIALECKTVGKFVAEEWEDYDATNIPFIVSTHVPPQYYAQVMWYYALGDFDEVYIARITDNKCYIYLIPRNKDMEAAILRKVKEAYAFLKNGGIPKASNSKEANVRWIDTVRDSVIKADDEMYIKYVQLKKMKDQISSLQKDCDPLETDIKNFMQDKEILTYEIEGKERKIATWKKGTKNTVDLEELMALVPNEYAKCMKETETRTLRLSKLA